MSPEQDNNINPEVQTDTTTQVNLPDNASPTPPDSTNLTPQKKRRSKKPMLIGLVVLLIASAGFAYYWLKVRQTTTQPASENTSSQSTNTTSGSKNTYVFYAVQNLDAMSQFNTATKQTQTVKLSDKTLFGGGLNSNSTLQTSKDGQIQAYTTAVLGESQGDGGPDVVESSLVMKKADTETVIRAFNPTNQITDMLLLPDGSGIYYMATSNKSGVSQTDMYFYDIQAKKDNLLKQNIFSTGDNTASSISAVSNNEIIFFSTGEGGISEYSYKDNVLSSRKLDIEKVCGDCGVESGQPLSPDGKTLVLEGGSIGDNWNYYSYDLTSNEGKQIYKIPKPTEQPRLVFWAPDSKRIGFDISADGNEGQNDTSLVFRFDILDVASGKITEGFKDQSVSISDQNYSKHFVEMINWSPDGKLIAFGNNGSIKLFDTSNGETTDTGIKIDSPLSSDTAFGWYEVSE